MADSSRASPTGRDQAGDRRGEKAISLGEGDASLLSSIGFYHFTVGNYDRAEELSTQALASSDQFRRSCSTSASCKWPRGGRCGRDLPDAALELLADKRFDNLRTLIISPPAPNSTSPSRRTVTSRILRKR